MFVVFNPLDIKDMRLTYAGAEKDIPGLIGEIDAKAIGLIKTRTVERDFQFIDQSDAVVVFYLTDKVSPGVLAEIYYAHRNQKQVFITFKHGRSPFMEDAASTMSDTIEESMEKITKY